MSMKSSRIDNILFGSFSLDETQWKVFKSWRAGSGTAEAGKESQNVEYCHHFSKDSNTYKSFTSEFSSEFLTSFFLHVMVKFTGLWFCRFSMSIALLLIVLFDHTNSKSNVKRNVALNLTTLYTNIGKNQKELTKESKYYETICILVSW